MANCRGWIQKTEYLRDQALLRPCIDELDAPTPDRENQRSTHTKAYKHNVSKRSNEQQQGKYAETKNQKSVKLMREHTREQTYVKHIHGKIKESTQVHTQTQASERPHKDRAPRPSVVGAEH